MSRDLYVITATTLIILCSLWNSNTATASLPRHTSIDATTTSTISTKSVFQCSSCGLESDSCSAMQFDPPLDRTTDDSVWSILDDEENGDYFYFNMSKALDHGKDTGTVLISFPVEPKKGFVIQVFHRSGLSKELHLDVSTHYRPVNKTANLTETIMETLPTSVVLFDVLLTISVDKDNGGSGVDGDSGFVLTDIQVRAIKGLEDHENPTGINSSVVSTTDSGTKCSNVCIISIVVTTVIIALFIVIAFALWKRHQNKRTVKVNPCPSDEAMALTPKTSSPNGKAMALTPVTPCSSNEAIAVTPGTSCPPNETMALTPATSSPINETMALTPAASSPTNEAIAVTSGTSCPPNETMALTPAASCPTNEAMTLNPESSSLEPEGQRQDKKEI